MPYPGTTAWWTNTTRSPKSSAKQESGEQAVFDSVVQRICKKTSGRNSGANDGTVSSNQNHRLSRSPAEPTSTGTAAEEGEHMTKEQLKTLIEQTKRNATRGAAQQIAALTQQVHNLRERLNMALTQIEKFEKHNRSSVGA